MDTMPVLFHGKKSGEARLERQALYTTVHVRCTARSGLWYAWAVGEEGEARIGILEPAHGEMSISRRGTPLPRWDDSGGSNCVRRGNLPPPFPANPPPQNLPSARKPHPGSRARRRGHSRTLFSGGNGRRGGGKESGKF